MKRTLVVLILVAAFPMIAASEEVQPDLVIPVPEDDGTDYKILAGSLQLDPEELPGFTKNPAGDMFIQDDTSTAFVEGFEGEFPGLWAVSGGNNNWDVVNDRSRSGETALWCNADGRNPVQGYQSNTLTTIVYGPFDMSGFDSGYLNFWHWTETELNGDFLFAGVSGDGELFQGYYISGMIQEWREQTLDISPYGGGEIYLMFRFVSDNNHNFEGVYLDHIALCFTEIGGAVQGETAELAITEVNHIPFNPSLGQTVELTMTIENSGTVSSGDFYIDLFSDQPMAPLPGDDCTVSQYFPNGLAAGQSNTIQFEVVYNIDGTKHLWAIIDAGEDVLEQDETDNLLGIYDVPVGIATHVTAQPYFDVVIPHEGGSFDYMVTMERFRLDATLDGWISITHLSYGNSIEVYHFATQLYFEGTPYGYDFNQVVPESAPPGDYIVTVSFGQYPWGVLDTGSFTFTKTGVMIDPDPTLGDPIDWPGAGQLMGNGEGMNANEMPVVVSLSPAYPNPFNAQTQVTLTLSNGSGLSVSLFNVQGRRVATIANGEYAAGSHTFSVDARDLASGTYLLHAKTGAGETAVQKLVLMK